MSWEIAISTEKEAQFVDDILFNFNKSQVPFTQDKDSVTLNFHIKDDKGAVIAGINAIMYCWKILFIDVLFVDAVYRGQQLGSRLLNKAQSEAKAMGATLAHLDTFDWQAKDFYLKQGYKIFGVLEDCPTGHRRYYLKKTL